MDTYYRDIKLHGHDYGVWYQLSGRITHVSCAGRWSKCPVAHLDLWTLNALAGKLAEVVLAEAANDAEPDAELVEPDFDEPYHHEDF